jgi:hypothetical protein
MVCGAGATCLDTLSKVVFDVVEDDRGVVHGIYFVIEPAGVLRTRLTHLFAFRGIAWTCSSQDPVVVSMRVNIRTTIYVLLKGHTRKVEHPSLRPKLMCRDGVDESRGVDEEWAARA